jgi:hypothetical protein
VSATLGTEAAPRSAQLQRILESRTFRNTEVLKRLLDYLGQKALAGETENLKEYTVGLGAFGKPDNYDPKMDSSVRVQAGKLRQKLDEYYRTEGVSDLLIVELPKGHFALEFRERDRPVVALPQSPEIRRANPLFPWIFAAVAIAIAAASAAYAMRAKREDPLIPRYRNPSIVALWQPFLEDSRPAIVSLGAPVFAKVSGAFFRDPSSGSWDRMENSAGVKAIEQSLDGKAIPANPYTGVGEAAAAFELARLFVSGHKDLNLSLSSALSWEDIARNNVIFVGPPKFNLQAKELPVQQDFTIDHGRIENLHPRKGEPPYFGETWSADRTALAEGHALIARLPGLHGAGFIMMLAATSTEGTRAAVEYVTRPDYAERLVTALRDPSGRIPRYFQAVVRARFKSQTPIQVEQVSVHVLGN